MGAPCLVVLTARGPDLLLMEGGSKAWRLNPHNAKNARYCVCVQNRNGGNWGGADQPHHHAFIVGRIKDVVPTEAPDSPDRFMVQFSEYARIDAPDAWPGGRNPVRYTVLEEFGITDPDTLSWQPMPPPPVQPNGISRDLPDEDGEGPGPLTIPEAKAGLARGLGVPESAVEISIRF